MKGLFTAFLLSFVSLSFGQQLEHYTQYQFNQFALNPAVAGTKNCIDIRTGYRFQWAGIDGAPQSGFINAHAPLRFGKKNRNAFGPKHGVGGQIKRDVFGPFFEGAGPRYPSRKMRLEKRCPELVSDCLETFWIPISSDFRAPGGTRFFNCSPCKVF